jgi:very-short-patch-repair endonuclease
MQHTRLSDLVAAQHGLATTGQLRAIGLDRRAVRARVDAGLLVPLSERVLRLRGAPETPHQRAMAAVLDAGPGSALARASALALWAIPGFELPPFHVVHGRAQNLARRPLGVVHSTRRLEAHHVVELYGIPVTTCARAIVDLAWTMPLARLERICDWAWSRRLLTAVGLHAAIDELGGRGRAGMGVLRALRDARPLDYRPPESSLEARCAEILRANGEAPLVAQVVLGDDDAIGRVDLFDPDLRIVFEVQSELFHSSISDREYDRARRSALEAAGFMVVELREFDVWHRPDRIVLAVRSARRRRRAELGMNPEPVTPADVLGRPA